jgi:hypothetical protein
MKRSVDSKTFTKRRTKSEPPNGLPVYRILTGPDDAVFCHRVSEALALGYKLYGSPAATFDGERVIVAQAVVWPWALGSAGGTKRSNRAG